MQLASPSRFDAEAMAECSQAGDRHVLARGLGSSRRTTDEGLRRSLRLARAPRGRRVATPASWGSPVRWAEVKSTLVDHLVASERSAGRRVAVLAADPSSPFRGEAILGDRVRMTRWHGDEGVYVRSLATRGALAGLAAAVRMLSLLRGAGYERVLLETVGVGQSEVDVARQAGTTFVVVTPAAGDGVQAVKAGVSEIADIFVVNKADQPGAQRMRRERMVAQHLVAMTYSAHAPPHARFAERNERAPRW